MISRHVRSTVIGSHSSQDAFLEEDDGAFVQDELARRQKVRQERDSRVATGENFEADLDTSLRGGKWKDAHMQLAASRHGLRLKHQ